MPTLYAYVGAVELALSYVIVVLTLPVSKSKLARKFLKGRSQLNQIKRPYNDNIEQWDNNHSHQPYCAPNAGRYIGYAHTKGKTEHTEYFGAVIQAEIFREQNPATLSIYA